MRFPFRAMNPRLEGADGGEALQPQAVDKRAPRGSAKDDTLPQRFLTHPSPSDKAKGVLPDLELMLRGYYQLRGPSETKLKELGLQGEIPHDSP